MEVNQDELRIIKIIEKLNFMVEEAMFERFSEPNGFSDKNWTNELYSMREEEIKKDLSLYNTRYRILEAELAYLRHKNNNNDEDQATLRVLEEVLSKLEDIKDMNKIEDASFNELMPLLLHAKQKQKQVLQKFKIIIE